MANDWVEINVADDIPNITIFDTRDGEKVWAKDEICPLE
jgi:hypothetical protein